MKRAAALLGLLGALSAGCDTYYDPCFDVPSLVKDLRILAVRTDPPEVLYDPGTFASSPFIVRPLAVHSDSLYKPIEVLARTCAPTTSQKCADSVPFAGNALAARDTDPELILTVSPEVLRASLAADPLAGYGGLRVQLEIVARGPDGAVARAAKTLVFSPDLPGTVPNHGLEIRGFTLFRGVKPQAVRPGFELDLDVAQSVTLRPLLAAGPGGERPDEDYDVVDLKGRRVRLRERISYTFFTTLHAQYGELLKHNHGADVADEPGPDQPQPPQGLVRLSATGEGPGRTWLVARDGRGAEAFSFLDFFMTDKRQCLNDLPNGTTVTSHCQQLEQVCQ